jgi:uncharacterized protein
VHGGVTGMVDVHVHVFPPEMVEDRAGYLRRDGRFNALYGSPKAAMATAADVLAHMDKTRVDMSVLVGFPFADQGLCRLVNDHILEAVRDHSSRFAGLACVAPDAPGTVAELERCLDGGLRGCGELAPRGGGDVHVGLDAVAGCLRERGLALMIHASEPVGHEYPGKGHFTPEDCYEFARRHPGLTIVFAHMGGGLFLYEAMPEVRQTLQGAYYDTAAVPYLYRPEVYEAALASAGPGKLLFGSDYPLLSPARYLEGFERLAPAAREAIQCGNARRVFGL